MKQFSIFNFQFSKKRWHDGQLMLLSVLLLSAILSIALFLTMSFVTNMRQARLVTDSVKAFYAADAGVELSLYRYFKNANEPTMEMQNNTWCCTLDARLPQGPGELFQVTSSGDSPSASSTNRLTRVIETGGY